MKQKRWITLATYVAYCINKELYKIIEYLKVRVEVLIEQQEKQNKRILLTNHQRIRITVKAKRLSRKMLEQYIVLFTPDTVMRWCNKLISEKYDGSCKRGKVGRPTIAGDSERIHFSQRTIVQHISAQLLNINLLENKDLVADEFLHTKWFDEVVIWHLIRCSK